MGSYWFGCGGGLVLFGIVRSTTKAEEEAI
jgi:hypothetical protein